MLLRHNLRCPGRLKLLTSDSLPQASSLRFLVGCTGCGGLQLEIGAVVVSVGTVRCEANAPVGCARRRSASSGAASAGAGHHHDAATLALVTFECGDVGTGDGPVCARTALARTEDHAVNKDFAAGVEQRD